jgi:hypothetical protein
MANGLYFLKLELNYLNDHTFNTELTDAQKWRYVQLYMLAKNCNAGGEFVSHGKALTIGDIAWHLHVDQVTLQEDLDAITKRGFIGRNGHGPYLTRYVTEQETPRTGAQRMEELRTRERDVLHGGDEPVTMCHTESDIESESESESEEESVSQEILQQPTDDDRSPTDSNLTDLPGKPEICKHAGIPPRYSTVINQCTGITSDDLLAELARNYSRKGRVKNPGLITGMNLTKPTPERAAAEWYERSRQLDHLPARLQSKLGLCSQQQLDGVDTLSDVATRKHEVEERVERFLAGGHT